MKVLSHVSIGNVGGSVLALELAAYVADQFNAKNKVDIRTNQRAWSKLVWKCSNVIEVLSANKEGNIYIEGLINGLDLNMNIKRSVLEQSKSFDRIVPALQEAIKKAGISKDDIQSVEVVGGSSRIPKVN